MPKFRYAWHMESERMLEPDDVADFIMETGRTPELMCPDENCRLAMPHTRITSVCCDPRNRKCGVTPHFRTHTDHRHAENCQYEVLGRHTDYILGHKDEFTTDFPDANLLRKIKDIDTELLPDEYTEEFAPREFMEAVSAITDVAPLVTSGELTPEEAAQKYVDAINALYAEAGE